MRHLEQNRRSSGGIVLVASGLDEGTTGELASKAEIYGRNRVPLPAIILLAVQPCRENNTTQLLAVFAKNRAHVVKALSTNPYLP